MSELFIGLMSGTSLDGVDAVLARFPEAGAMQVLGHAHQPFDAKALREELLSLNQSGRRRAPPRCTGGQWPGPQLCRPGGPAAGAMCHCGPQRHPGTRRPWPDRAPPPRRVRWHRLHPASCSTAPCWPSKAASPWSATCAAAMWPPAARARPWCPPSTALFSGADGRKPRACSISAASAISASCWPTSRRSALTADPATA